MFKKPEVNPETCPKCPHRFSERGCPRWMKVTETDETTGVTREKHDCFYEIMARWMTQMAKLAACDAKATCDIRNEVVKRQDALAQLFMEWQPNYGQLELKADPPALEAPSNGKE